VIDGGKITLAQTGSRNKREDEVVDLGGSYVLPGFIELHTHGAGLFEFTLGKYDRQTGQFDGSEETYAQELPRYAKLRASTGATCAYLGTWAAPIERLQHCYRQLKKYVDSPANGTEGTLIPGGMLEGPFINAGMSGAQNPKFVFEPAVDLFDRINESGVIRLVNIVPDWGQPAYRLIETLTGRGISVGAGHTNATYDQFERAIASGLKYCIHFLNGPTGHSYKVFNGGGALEAVLREDIYAEIIADGVHVAPRYVRDVLARKGFERVMAVTDALFASQAGSVKEFEMNGIKGRVDNSGKFVYVVGRKQMTLFSSIVTMDTVFGNLLSWLTADTEGVWHRHEALDFDRAVRTASECCSKNIVQMLRRGGGDDIQTGELADGRWADLVVADITGEAGSYTLNVKQAYVRGRKVYDVADTGG